MSADRHTPPIARRDAWAAGWAEAAELDRRRTRAMTPSERIAEGLALVRIAAKLQRGRRPSGPGAA